MSTKLKTALIGTGFMGRVHCEAIRRLGFVEVAAVAGSSASSADEFAKANHVPKSTGDWRELIADPTIDAIHVLTPNAQHFNQVKAALEAGKHVLCEKPLTISVREAAELLELASGRNIRHAINHNLRFYPVVQQIRQMVRAGDLGEILVVQGTYSQDWLLYPSDYNWRVEEQANGALRTMGDIGSHWMDLVQHLTALPITAVCADLQTFHKTRQKPVGAVETFGNAGTQHVENVPVTTEDFGAALLRLGDRTRGAFTVSQVSAGCKNRFQMEIFGTRSGVVWNQERPDELWIGLRDEPNRLLLKNPGLMYPEAARYADLPGGHSEGYDDTHKQLFKQFYLKIIDPNAAVEFPTFEDGLRGMRLLEKVLESHQNQGWVTM